MTADQRAPRVGDSGDSSPVDPTQPLLKLDGIKKSFGGVHALRGVTFELLPGEVHALLGQNGAGKSTLIKILAGVTTKDEGRITIRGRDSEFRSPGAARDAGIAVVYQELSLVPSLSVSANLFLNREPHNLLSLVRQRHMDRAAQELLTRYGLPLDPHALVGNLPFAYRQLTEIAKALSGEVSVLVLDEPTSSLSGGEEEILFEAITQVTRRGVGVVYVTHRLPEVFRLSNRVTVLRDGANVSTFKTTDADMNSLVAAIVGPRNEAFREATVVGLGPQGERAASPDVLELTEEESSQVRARRFKLGVVLHTGESDWSRQQLRGIADTASKYGVEIVDVVDPHFKVDQQIAGIGRMIERHPDAIISIPVDEEATAAAYKQIGQAGIKLVLMDNAPKGLESGKDYTSVVSADNYSAATAAASELARYVDQNGTVGVIGYGVDFFATDQREIAFKKWMKDNRPDITVKESQFVDPDEARTVASDFLAAHPEVDGLFVVWDEPALAAASAARDGGRAIPITTIDLGQEVALLLAKGGSIKGVGAQLPYDQGVAEVLVAMNALLGKQPPPWIALPAVPVTPANLLEVYEKVWHAAPPAELVEASRSAPGRDSTQIAPSSDGHEQRDVAKDSALLELRDVRNDRLRGVSLAVSPGEIVGLAGMLGSGRTEILETVFGLRRVRSGELRLNGKPVVIRDPTNAIQKGIAFVPEDRHQQGLVLTHSIERNVALPRLPQLEEFGFFRRGASVARAQSAMRELSVKAPSPSSLVGNLSGGNQQKVVFGKWREPSPTLLLLDEPTAGVDVGARGEIYDVIHRMAGLGSGVLAVSSEFAELLLLCDRIGIVANGQVVKELTRAEIENEEHLHRLVQEASQV